MPLKSKAQMRWMAANRPDLLPSWKQHTPSLKRLPERIGKSRGMLSLVEIRKAVEQPQFAPIVDSKIKQRKKKAKHLSEASAALGGAALAAKAPSYAAAALRKFPKAPLKRIAAAAPKADKFSEHVVPASLGVGALGSINFARLQGQEAKRPGAIEPKVAKAAWTPHVSPAAEDAYNDLGARKRRRYADAAVYGVGTGAAAKLAHSAITVPLPNPATSGKARRLARGTFAVPALAATSALSYGAVRRGQEGRALQERRSKIKAKGLERQAAGQYGRGRPKPPLKDVKKAFGLPAPTGLKPLAPRAGGLMRTATGKTVTRRGAIPGTGKFTPTLRRIV